LHFFRSQLRQNRAAIRLFNVLAGILNEDGFLTIRDKAMLEVFHSAALRVSELIGLKKYRMERSSVHAFGKTARRDFARSDSLRLMQ